LLCPNAHCQELLNEHENDWSRTAYCPNCGFYEEEKYLVPKKSYTREEVVYVKRPKKKKRD